MYTSRPAAKVMATLAVHAHPPLRYKEIEKATGLTSSEVQTGLRALARQGLIEKGIERSRVVYRAAESPYERAVLDAALVDIGFRDALLALGGRLRFAMVIGSFARGRHRPDSDIDLLVVGGVDRRELRDLLEPIATRHDRVLDLIALTDDAYRDRIGGGDYLLRDSTSNGLLIAGDRDLVDA